MEKRITPALREEIEQKRQKIIDNPKLLEFRMSFMTRTLASIGDIYSFWIENPELRKALLTDNLQEETVKKRARAGIRAVLDGWQFLMDKTKDGGNFLDVFTPYDLERLNTIIYRQKMVQVQKIKPGERFRTSNVTLNSSGYTVPSPHKVPQMVLELLRDVHATYQEDPLEAAILAHLGIAAIQPFEDGNKRCARLLQDKILVDGKFVPALIQAGEAKYYLELFCKTLIPYRDRDVNGQREFFNYCASKVNTGLDQVLDDLELPPRQQF